MANDDRRMIEHQIPLEAVNYASSKEKKHPRRHVELIHQWPARRPRSASRVAIAAALLKVPKSPKEIDERLQLLADLAPYECSRGALEKARKLIRDDNGGQAPKVLDLFAGGGAIPLEAANLGCEAHAVELNPVAHIIELATCVYPQRYGARLADLVEKWGKWVLDRVRAEIGDLYPKIRIAGKAQAKQLVFANSGGSSDGTVEVEPIAYLWTRTVPCVNRDCGATVPLVRQTWLCRKDDRAIALKMVPDKKAKGVRFEIVSAAKAEELGFDPADFNEGGDAECPICGATIDADRVKEAGRQGNLGAQVMAVAGTIDGERGRAYLPADAVTLPSSDELRKRCGQMGEVWPGPAALRVGGTGGLGKGDFGPFLCGLDTYDKLFTDRQVVTLLAFTKTIRRAFHEIEQEVGDAGLAAASATFLAMAFDRMVIACNSLSRWEPQVQRIKGAFSRQALAMVWDYAEIVPYMHTEGSYATGLKAVVESARGLASVPSAVEARRCSATDIPFADSTFDAIVTDPPYYDNISYADLSDFFFVWLKRTLAELYPEHLSGEQTPKRQEATVVPYRHGGDDAAARAHYENLMTAAFREGARVLKPGGPMVVVYAHKTVAGWATLVDALRRVGCGVTEAWPLRTESDARLNALNTAALATSIFLVARKRTDDATCNDYDDEVLPEVASVIDERVRTLWELGLNGADLIVAVIGAALGPFTRFAKVRRANGREVSTADFLEEAQRAVLEAVLKQVVRAAGGKDVSVSGIDPISRLYVVARLQFGDGAADYDVFKNLAIGALPPGVELDGMKGALMQGKRALLAKKGSKITLRTFEDRGAERDLGLPEDGRTPPLVDVLHRLLYLQKHRPAEVPKFLSTCGADLGEVRLLAQALGGRPLRAEPTPGAQKDERSAEQRAVDTLLASYQDISRSQSAGPLFDQVGRSKGKG